MGVVLGEATRPRHALDHTGLLIAIDGAELEEAKRQLTVGAAARVEDEIVHGAIHGLHVVVDALLADRAISIYLGIEVHGRVHPLGVPVEVP